jgi:hypothetical protein
MTEFKKTSLYLSLENLKRLKKAAYLSNKPMARILNDILNSNLDEYLKKIEEQYGNEI